MVLMIVPLSQTVETTQRIRGLPVVVAVLNQ